MTDDDVRGEEAVLREYLDHFRTTFERKCEGLDAEQLARRSVPPSTLSLLGLARHLAAVELSWWRRVMGRNLDLPKMWGKDLHRNADFDGAVADDDVVAEAWAAWRAEVAHGRAFQASHPMDYLGSHDDGPIEMREVVVHLIEEYARHCGHADLLRECIDGRTG
ncbi:DinB family protein [Nocardioides sp. URHA0020]|uniref:DinB family protein n=1 Tax=Nocardioides sp. URHA0020 TaxID=1380392 RepID=UPI00048F1C4B|nr:DinB family protein [Nocardioides sp. URHA0020]